MFDYKQRTISKAYEQGYDNINWGKKKKEKKIKEVKGRYQHIDISSDAYTKELEVEEGTNCPDPVYYESIKM